MIITTSDNVAGRNIIKTIGLVKGNTVRARNIGRDIRATVKNVIGGEITDYTELMTEAREEAINRMVTEAKEKEANAIVSVRFATSMIMQSASEIMAYGTAVIIE
ncbi:MAG: YbjQ family protein [Dehalococcoidales bacterium]|nr:YbjQ family protein [Dehalococcoidales bacterium]